VGTLLARSIRVAIVATLVIVGCGPAREGGGDVTNDAPAETWFDHAASAPTPGGPGATRTSIPTKEASFVSGSGDDPTAGETAADAATGDDAADIANASATDVATTDTGATCFAELADVEPLDDLPPAVCIESTEPDALTALLAGDDLVLGADYQRAYPLVDGRVLWLFQDAFVATSHGSELIHNIGVLQSGACFQLLRNGTGEDPTPYLLPELTDRYHHWFWALGGAVTEDGDLDVFVAEMRELGEHYLSHTVPVATWLVTIDGIDLGVLGARPAPDASAALYGWSVVPGDGWTYLYAHCYRQFGYDAMPFTDPPVYVHDFGCSADVTVARVPRGRHDTVPQYWDGDGWVDRAADAVPVIPREGRAINPTQVAVLDGRFIAVTKVDDWLGDTILLDTAPAAEGPWRTYAAVQVAPGCAVCNTYFASIVPYGIDDVSIMVGLSCNTWHGDDLGLYAPRFLRVPTPPPPA
jgi:hypothetical protein